MSAALPEYEAVPDDLELTYLQVVHRHGERTPVRTRLESLIPNTWHLCEANMAMFATILDFNAKQGESNDGIPIQYMPLKRFVERPVPNDNPVAFKSGACHLGQLTNLGRQNLTNLGARLRSIYIEKLGYLSDRYSSKEVYIRSSDYPRTLDSVQQLVGGGLYPADKRDAGTTLEIRTRDLRDENLFSNRSCTRLGQLNKAFRQAVSDMHQDKFIQLKDLLKEYVDDISLDSHPSANGIFDSVVAAKAHGYEFPPEFDDPLMRDLERVVVDESFYGHMASNEVRRLGLGRLMGDIRDRMVFRANGSDKNSEEADFKLSVYSGHDSTVAPLLIILGGYDKRWPPFGSALIFELFKSKATSMWPWKQPDHYVRVRYNDKVLELPGCAQNGNHHASGDQSLCTLDAFLAIVRDQVPDDWEKECSHEG
ncbi:phosphoglycerate mutase-like protein [Hesseltinella vesiculosa]|uniref:Phosphoglycerate mutase-like protein n=1 Tax=Hesseltinella vesiculosa TaxID=101127 RepID=A0A1X2GKC8_9FUNG|nr:phosphoglycerate mutase-like protein [Hesseltinella vesiculosa]